MACNRWEEEGLLYSSEELDGGAKSAYESHLRECAECKSELDAYRSLHTTMAGMLEEETDPAVDSILKKICERPFKATTGWASFAGIFTKVALPMLVLLVGFGGGVYFATSGFIGSSPAQVAVVKTQTIAAPATEVATVDSNIPPVRTDDSLAPRRVGNLSGDGIVPVNLSDK